MMFKNFLVSIIVSSGIAVSTQAKSLIFSKINVADVKSCPLSNYNSEDKRVELTKSWESLPAKVLIAMRAHMIVEGEGYRTETVQDFLNPNAKVGECLSRAEKSSELKSKQRFSVLAPTIIDLTIDKKTGSSVWNFQLFLEKDKVSSWNSVSKASNQNFDLAKLFKDQGFQEKYYRLRGNQYEIVAFKEMNGKLVTISIIFETVDGNSI